MSPSPRSVARAEAISAFTLILQDGLAALPGARGAALVDREGETVDYVGEIDPFELKLAAAHWQIVMCQLHGTRLASTHQLVVRSTRRSFVVRRLHDDYAVVLVFLSRAAFAASERALAELEVRLCLEAGWGPPAWCAPWIRVEVDTERATTARGTPRPIRLLLGEGWQPVDVLGRMVGLRKRERGFRVRLPSGDELLLVREATGHWFADRARAARA